MVLGKMGFVYVKIKPPGRVSRSESDWYLPAATVDKSSGTSDVKEDECGAARFSTASV